MGPEGIVVAEERVEVLAAGLAGVRDRLAAARAAAGRDDDVDLVVVTKYFPAADVHALLGLGVRDIGENREQEARAKVAALREADALPGDTRVHMLGRVQRNKANHLVNWADVVHSVDSGRVAEALGRAVVRAREEGRRHSDLDVLVQLSLDGDTARGGVPVAGARALVDSVASTPGLRAAGVMVVPPVGADARSAFAEAARIRAAILRDHPGATTFSAGMSGDLEEAVAAGSTCVRVGTAIMGSRPIPWGKTEDGTPRPSPRPLAGIRKDDA